MLESSLNLQSRKVAYWSDTYIQTNRVESDILILILILRLVILCLDFDV